MGNKPDRPNFFIVGAPKCGTTSLYEYIRQHPDVYMPFSEERYWQYKEPYYFCEELITWPGLRIQDEASYLSLFKNARGEKRIGEATALYLYCKHAAERIKTFSPDAKIIIMLRNPIEMMVAWHHDCLRWGHENVADFEKAVGLESRREKGKRIPPGSGYAPCLSYTKMATFEPQVRRFLEVFGKEAVKILLLDDLASRPGEVFTEVAEFLEIDASFSPSFARHNQQKILLQSDLIDARIKGLFRSYAPWAVHLKPVVPSAFKSFYRQGLGKLGKSLEKPAIDPRFMSKLSLQMDAEIDRLGNLLGKDLHFWTEKNRQHYALAA